MQAPPWSELPPGVAAALRPHLREIVAEVIAGLARDVPSYARPLEGAFGEGVRLGVQVALGRFLDLPGTAEPALRSEDVKVYLALGRGELQQGRELQTLLAAYRVGARIAFRRVAALARDVGFDADVVVVLAESVFAYIDELSAASAQGYAQEQATRAGETDRRRAELLALLLSGTADAPAVAESAALAGWTLPTHLMCAVVAPSQGEGLGLRLGQEALVGPYEDVVVAVIHAPVGAAARTALSARLAGRGAVLGPSRPWAAVRTSLALARLALSIAESGALVGDPLYADEHLATLVVHRDQELVDELATVRLAPLEGARERARDRLAETLLSWLRHRGERQHVAHELHVHPQTVGYRLGQLRELFGDVLEDPQGRFELELALRSRLRRSAQPTDH